MEIILNNITNPFTVAGVLAVMAITWGCVTTLWNHLADRLKVRGLTIAKLEEATRHLGVLMQRSENTIYSLKKYKEEITVLKRTVKENRQEVARVSQHNALLEERTLSHASALSAYKHRIELLESNKETLFRVMGELEGKVESPAKKVDVAGEDLTGRPMVPHSEAKDDPYGNNVVMCHFLDGTEMDQGANKSDVYKTCLYKNFYRTSDTTFHQYSE
jgi:hypothetical protein